MISDEDQASPTDHALRSQVMASEFDLEIGFRERMKQSLKERIAWAMLLKESLQEAPLQLTAASGSFKFAAFEALRASEKPIEILLNKEELVPPNVRLQEATQSTRPAPKAKARIPRDLKAVFLYIRSSNLGSNNRKEETESEFKVLKCPVCSRTTFTSLQGLLNHARISHSLEWGTHEECIHTCAVTDHNINIGDGIEVGSHSGGILPGLRTIFEMAVGPPRADSAARLGVAAEPESQHSTSTHLTETLGLHEDTPALAFFLGKEPIRRGIKAHQQDETVDVDGFTNDRDLPFKDHWRLRFAQRGGVHEVEGVEKGQQPVQSATPGPGGDTSRPDSTESGVFGDSQKAPSHGALGTVTRFHFTTRIVVTDRSLWIESGGETQFTHKWMLALDAPSYAYDITTILRSMTITPLSPPDAVKCHQTMVDKPPYAVVGLASQPFLARIELIFNEINGGDLSNEGQSFFMEHWVDLDPLRSSAAVVGEEQICDIELDKRTAIKPKVPGQQTMNLKALWALATEGTPSNLQEPNTNDTNSPSYEYEKILRDLLPQFPLTLQGVRRKRGMKVVPYRLATSESQFSNFIEGRRKAIEWGRARAIHDAYNEIVEQTNSPGSPALTTADVQAWLREEGHLYSEAPRQTVADPPKPEKSVVGELEPKWCCICGLDLGLHALIPRESMQGEGSRVRGESEVIGVDIKCPIAAQDSSVLKLRPINVERLKTTKTTHSVQRLSFNSSPLNHRHIAQLADPGLTLAVRHLIRPLKLSSFGSGSSCDSPFPLDHLGGTPAEIETELAPYSMLATLLRPFIRRIVLPGLDIAKRQKKLAGTLAPSRPVSKKAALESEPDTSLLTPVHILSGIRSRGREAPPGSDGVDEAILLCLSDLGMPHPPPSD